MNNVSYKVRTLDEYFSVDEKTGITKSIIKYEIVFNVPLGLRIAESFMMSVIPKDNINIDLSNYKEENTGYNLETTFRISIESKTVCRPGDTFNEVTGKHICETKAEVKLLEIIKKTFELFYINLETVLLDKEDMLNRIQLRYEKNFANLERLSEIETGD